MVWEKESSDERKEEGGNTCLPDHVTKLRLFRHGCRSVRYIKRVRVSLKGYTEPDKGRKGEQRSSKKDGKEVELVTARAQPQSSSSTRDLELHGAVYISSKMYTAPESWVQGGFQGEGELEGRPSQARFLLLLLLPPPSGSFRSNPADAYGESTDLSLPSTLLTSPTVILLKRSSGSMLPASAANTICFLLSSSVR